MRKQLFLEAQIKGNYEHIRDIEEDLFISFWDLMETVNHHFEIENNEYVDIIDELVNFGDAIVGDYNITLDNQNTDNLEVLNQAKKELLK
jgi:hypothetical protein